MISDVLNMISDLIPRVEYDIRCVEYDIRCVEYDIRCDTKGITGHEAVTGDTTRARRLGIYTDRDHYSQKVRDAPKKKNGNFGNFSQRGGGGLRNSQNYFIFTVSFFVCRNMEVLGGSRIPKSKNREFFGGSPIPKTFEK